MKNMLILSLVLLPLGCTDPHGDRTAATSGAVSSSSLQTQSVSWTQLVNATASGGTLTKSGGQPALDDAGGQSAQTIAGGDGWLEFTVADTQPFRFAGLGRARSGVSAAGIDFAFRLQSGRADVYELGVWKADNLATSGDVLRVSVESGVVKLYKNGTAFYTSKTKPQCPLRAEATFIDVGGAVTNARLGLPAPTTTTPPPTTVPTATGFVSAVTATPTADGSGATVTWNSAVNADAQVHYGLTSAYDTWSPAANESTTSHSIAVSGLTPGTTYHFSVHSYDGGNNVVSSSDATFTTLGSSAAAGNHHHFCGWLVPTGWVPADQDPYYAAFVAHASSFDAVHPVWYTLTGTTTYKANLGESSPLVLSNTTAGGKRTLLIPTITAADGQQPEWVSQMIHDPSLREQHESAIVALVTAKKYDGIDLDYEHLADSDRDAFSTFAEELAAQLHAQGKTLSFAVQAESSSKFGFWDYERLSAAVDQLHVMGYDFHGIGTSHPGPVAPLGWIREVLAYIQSLDGGTRSGKFILGLPNYGVAAAENSTVGYWCQTLDCINLVQGVYETSTDHMNSCPLTNGVPMAAGRSPNNSSSSQGHLYFDDIASHAEKVAAAKAAGLGGITYWTIGGEPDRPGPQSFFDMVRSYFPQ